MYWRTILGSVLAGCGLALMGPVSTAEATTLLFDFGNNERQTVEPGWNNVVHENGFGSPTLTEVVDSTGATVPGVTLEETDPFYIIGQPSQGGSESPAGAAAGYPVEATDDYYFGHTGAFGGGDSSPTGGFKLTGLNQAVAYDFTFFSSRHGVDDDRETAFSVAGANNGSGTIATSNNDDEVLNILGIVPDANSEIFIEVSAGLNNDNGNRFYYLNLMQVDFVPVPEPSSALLLLAGTMGLIGLRRR